MEKLAAIPGKATNHGRHVKRPIIEIDQIDAPLARSGIVEAQRLRFNTQFLIGAGHVELFEVRVAIKELFVVRDSVVLHPDIGIIEPIRKAANVRFPVADEEVKVVRAIALREVCGIRGRLRLKCHHSQCRTENKQCCDFELARIHGNHPSGLSLADLRGVLIFPSPETSR